MRRTPRRGIAAFSFLLAGLAGLAGLVGLATACTPETEAAGPPRQPPALESDALVTADGLKLPIMRWLPIADEPKAIIVALHGMNDYSNAFAMPGAWWAEHGIATYAYDQRCFGRAPQVGLWPGTHTLVADLDAMVALMHERYPKLPVYLLGESMGGAVAMATLARPDRPQIAGAILAAPAVWGRATMDLGTRVALFLGAHSLPWYRLTGEGLHIVPSDNRAMLIALAHDPLVIKETRIDTIWGLVNLMDAALAASQHLDDVPLLILYGEHDEVIPKEPTLDMIEALPPDPLHVRRIAIYPKGYHMLLRDLEAKTVWADVLAWIEDPKAPLPSGADRTGLAALGKD